MRITMLAQFYPPLIGGEERHARNLSLQLVKRGHDVSVITLQHPGLAEYEEEGGVRIHRIQGWTQQLKFLYSDRRHATPYPDPGVVSAMRTVIEKEKPQIVHAHNWIVHSFVPLKKASNAKLVVSLHDYSRVCATKKLLYEGEVCSGAEWVKCLRCSIEHYGLLKALPTTTINWAMTRIERGVVDLYTPVSNAVAVGNKLAESGVKWEVIPNFVPDDVGEVPPADEQYLSQLPKEEFLLFVGAFGRYKGVDLIIEAYRKLENPPPLVLIGYETPEYPVETQNMPNGVTVLLNWPHNAVMQAWKRCMIALTPSMWMEPCATTPMEAMAVCKPVIATKLGGLTDIVLDGESGILIEPGDVDGLANAIRTLAADPALREKMGAAGLQHVRNFQSGTVVPHLEGLYQQLLSASH